MLYLNIIFLGRDVVPKSVLGYHYFDSKSNIVLYLKCLSEHLMPNFLVYGLISTKFFSFNWNILHEIIALLSYILE